MRFRYEEYSPKNKKQYVIACGSPELRALLDAARSMVGVTPDRTKEQHEFKQALRSAIRGLKEALELAEANEDDGKRREPYKGTDKWVG